MLLGGDEVTVDIAGVIPACDYALEAILFTTWYDVRKFSLYKAIFAKRMEIFFRGLCPKRMKIYFGDLRMLLLDTTPV